MEGALDFFGSLPVAVLLLCWFKKRKIKLTQHWLKKLSSRGISTLVVEHLFHDLPP
jgi:hypothetical protein